MKSSEIKVTLNLEPDDSKIKGRFIAYVHKKTNSGKLIKIYETANCPHIARRRLSKLLGFD